METWDCLVVDDEKLLLSATTEYLGLMGIRAAGAASADECARFLEENSVRLIVLDINLEDGSGFDLCREIRQASDVPILFLSARSSDDDKIAAYTLGGDDYIQKPCALSILSAKIKAVLRRCGDSSLQQETNISGYTDDHLQVNAERHEVHVDGRLTKLTPTEFSILLCLIERSERVVTKKELFDIVWGDPVTSDAALNVHISHLRKQIEQDPSNPRYIKTVHGFGYRFVPQC